MNIFRLRSFIEYSLLFTKVHRCCKLSRYRCVYDFAQIYVVLMHFNLGQLCKNHFRLFINKHKLNSGSKVQ